MISIIKKTILACLLLALPVFSSTAANNVPLQLAHHDGHYGDGWYKDGHGWGKHTGYWKSVYWYPKVHFHKGGKECVKSCYKKFHKGHKTKKCNVECYY